jgi:hypothetical protein
VGGFSLPLILPVTRTQRTEGEGKEWPLWMMRGILAVMGQSFVGKIKRQ